MNATQMEHKNLLTEKWRKKEKDGEREGKRERKRDGIKWQRQEWD